MNQKFFFFIYWWRFYFYEVKRMQKLTCYLQLYILFIFYPVNKQDSQPLKETKRKKTKLLQKLFTNLYLWHNKKLVSTCLSNNYQLPKWKKLQLELITYCNSSIIGNFRNATLALLCNKVPAVKSNCYMMERFRRLNLNDIKVYWFPWVHEALWDSEAESNTMYILWFKSVISQAPAKNLLQLTHWVLL